MRLGVRLPLDTIVTMSAVMKSGKVKRDNICFKKSIPDTKFKRRHNVRPGESGEVWRDGTRGGRQQGQGWFEAEHQLWPTGQRMG